MSHRPNVRPHLPFFSSGPCVKRPGWSLDALSGALLSRSHRSPAGKDKLAEVIDRHRSVLGIPADYRVAIVPASGTGAVEMALWSLLGARGVDALAWDVFGSLWAADIRDHLNLDDVRLLDAPYGSLPDLKAVDWQRDVVFTWNATTAGVCVPNGDWIADDRDGLAICDATSAVFAMDVPWNKLDATTWSWQKCLGGEAGYGMVALSPRAVERLHCSSPTWPSPKIFRLLRNGELIEGVFKGETINTPSMLAVEDVLDALKWAEGIGGLPMLIRRSTSSLRAVADVVDACSWIDFLAVEPATRSNTSMCLRFTESWITHLVPGSEAKFSGRIAEVLAQEEVAFDIRSHRDAPPGLRIWGGPTVETSNIKALMPWLQWAYQVVRAECR